MRTKYFQESIHCKIGSAPNIVPIYFWTLLNKSVHIGTLGTLNSATLLQLHMKELSNFNIH